MSANLEKIEEEAFSLSAQERARLALNLIKSLDNDDDADAVPNTSPSSFPRAKSESTAR